MYDICIKGVGKMDLKWILAIDAGAYEVKGRTRDHVFKFRSTIGPYRHLHLVNADGNQMEAGDYIVEYEDEKLFLGNIAWRECHAIREPRDISKAHEETKIRVLVAVHQYGKIRGNCVVIGQPIRGMVDKDRDMIEKMLKGSHTITVNNIRKTFSIDDVRVAPEGSGAYFSMEDRPEEIANIIDAGSSTFNYLRVEDGYFIDRKSGTLAFGAETHMDITEKQMAEAILAEIRGKWDLVEPTYLCGGIAEYLYPYVKRHFKNIQLIKPVLYRANGPKVYSPQYANAFGYYSMGKAVFADE
ncbi:ParM/StbA family protein [Bacillus sp. X1(2014)]|uniref:ParM/StbA family protein n=1 Tax=Bacillus sp. X1(2014) TaxID=1565991 RepID=UPI0011A0FED1|nr:ParM/StbA family protein [Bacillus sp. X1(2014)]